MLICQDLPASTLYCEQTNQQMSLKLEVWYMMICGFTPERYDSANLQISVQKGNWEPHLWYQVEDPMAFAAAIWRSVTKKLWVGPMSSNVPQRAFNSKLVDQTRQKIWQNWELSGSKNSDLETVCNWWTNDWGMRITKASHIPKRLKSVSSGAFCRPDPDFSSHTLGRMCNGNFGSHESRISHYKIRSSLDLWPKWLTHKLLGMMYL